MFYCSMCGTVNDPENKFCRMCGTKLRRMPQEKMNEKAAEDGGWVCWKCGAVMKDDVSFCIVCGMIRDSY